MQDLLWDKEGYTQEFEFAAHQFPTDECVMHVHLQELC